MIAWTHTISGNPLVAWHNAQTVGYTGGWRRAPQFVDGLQLLAAWTAYVVARLSREPCTTVQNEAGALIGVPPVTADSFDARERRQAAAVLVRGFALLARDQVPAGGVVATGGSAQAGALPAAGVVVLAIGVAAIEGGVLAFTADRASQVIDRELERRAELSDRENARRLKAETMMRALTHSIDVLTKHVDRETAEGRQIPLSAAERHALRLTEGAQKDLARSLRKEPPYRGREPLKPFFGETFGAFLGAGAGLALLAIGGAAALWLLGTNKKETA